MRKLGYISVLLMPSGLILLSMGGMYLLLGALILGVYTVSLTIPVVSGARGGRLKRASITPILLLMVVFIAYLRAVANGVFEFYKMFSLVAIWLVIVIGFYRWNKLAIPASSAWRGVQLYVVVNVLAHFAGIPSPDNAYSEAGEAKLIGLFGLHVDRVLFPFSLGVNGFGVVAGLATVVGFVFLFKKADYMNFSLFAVSVLGLLLSDSRGATLFSLVTMFVFLVFFALRKRKKIVLSFGFVLILIYPLLSLLIYMAVDYILGDVSDLVRSGGGVLSGRDVIWEAVYYKLLSADTFNVVFGWGHFGQVASRASAGYSQLFSHLDNMNPEQVNVHSSALQMILNMGLFGLLFLMALCFSRVRLAIMMLNSGDLRDSTFVIFGVVVYGIVAGATDLTLNENNLIFFYLLLVISAWPILNQNIFKVREGGRE